MTSSGSCRCGLMRLERAVLAMRDARPRQRQRDVAREGDAAAHRLILRMGARVSSPAPMASAPPVSSSCWSSPPSPAALAAARASTTGGRLSPAGPPLDATLLLDFAPNAVHAGIYLALAARTTTEAEGVDLRRRSAPTASTDADQGSCSAAGPSSRSSTSTTSRSRASVGEDLVGVMALVQRPLAAVLAAAAIRAPARPRGPQGRRHRAAERRRGPRVDRPRRRRRPGQGARQVTIGFNAVASVVSGRVAGATAFWNVEGVALKAQRPARRSSASTTTARRPTPSSSSSHPRGRCSRTPTWCAGRSARSSAATRWSSATRTPRCAISPPGRRTSIRRRPSASSTRSAPASFQAGGKVGDLDPQRLQAWATWEVQVRDREAQARRRDGVRRELPARRLSALLRADPAELVAHGLRAAPHLRDLDPARPRLAHGQLALDPRVVEQRAARRGRPGRRRRGRSDARRAAASASRACEYGWALICTRYVAASM